MTGFRELLLSSVLTSLLLFRSANACDKNATVNCLTALNGTGIDQNTPNVDAVCRVLEEFLNCSNNAGILSCNDTTTYDQKMVLHNLFCVRNSEEEDGPKVCDEVEGQKCLNRWTVRHPTVDTARFGRDPDYGLTDEECSDGRITMNCLAGYLAGCTGGQLSLPFAGRADYFERIMYEKCSGVQFLLSSPLYVAVLTVTFQRLLSSLH